MCSTVQVTRVRRKRRKKREFMREFGNVVLKRSNSEFSSRKKLGVGHLLSLEMAFSPEEFLAERGEFVLQMGHTRLELTEESGSLEGGQKERTTRDVETS